MSTPYDALNSGQQYSPVGGTDELQLANFSGNQQSVFIQGGLGCLVDNSSAATLLVVVNLLGPTGSLNLICEPWGNLPLNFQNPIDSINIFNMSTGPLPIPFSPVHSYPIKDGFVSITGMGDNSSLFKKKKIPSGPRWYESVETSKQGFTFLIGAAGLGGFNPTDIHGNQISSLFAVPPVQSAGITEPLIVDLINTGSLSGGAVADTAEFKLYFFDKNSLRQIGGNASTSGDQIIYLESNQGISMDISEMGPCYYAVLGGGKSNIVNVEVIVRGR